MFRRLPPLNASRPFEARRGARVYARGQELCARSVSQQIKALEATSASNFSFASASDW